MFSECVQTGPMFRVVNNKDLLINLLIFSILISLVTIVAAQSVFAATISDNKTSEGNFANMTFVGNMMPRKNMTMPGGNMTFGASLLNAKIHLTEAIMDLKNGNTKGAAMELNQTAQSIKLYQQELKVMMMQVKNMMTHMKKAGSGSSNATSSNSTS
jgi:hypothetical protein